MNDRDRLPPEQSEELRRRRGRIISCWTTLDAQDDAGRTTWEVLDCIRDEVCEALQKGAAGIVRAESLTAKALLLIEGDVQL